MMENIGTAQTLETARVFMMMGLTGIIIGFIFDVFRAFHISFKKVGPKFDIVSVQITDVFFAISSFCVFIVGLYIFNNGEVRSYCILGAVSGVVIYFMIFAPVIGRIMKLIFSGIYAIFHFAWSGMNNLIYFFVNKHKKTANLRKKVFTNKK